MLHLDVPESHILSWISSTKVFPTFPASPCQMLSPTIDGILTNVRDLSGKILRSVKISERPSEQIRIPSLGREADDLVDSLGLSPSAILEIHNLLLKAVKSKANSKAQDFIDGLVDLGMAYMEAMLVWNSIDKNLAVLSPTTAYRYKLALGVL